MTTPGKLTQEVLAAFEGTPDPRLRELFGALIRHLHAFAAETRLTPLEWRAGIEFLTATGQRCDAQRQEFILLSDVLGLSSLVEDVNSAAGATEPTVLGPFYRPGAPKRAAGEHTGRAQDGPPALIRGVVTDLAGTPLPGAALDVWQASGNGLYDTQDPDQPPYNLRGAFLAGPDGRYEFRTARPGSYPIPGDGPVGELLHAAGRHGWRAAHIHVIVSAPGYLPVTTHIFGADDPYLDSDVVFGVKKSLVKVFRPAGEADPPDVEFVAEMNFVLATQIGTLEGVVVPERRGVPQQRYKQSQEAARNGQRPPGKLSALDEKDLRQERAVEDAPDYRMDYVPSVGQHDAVSQEAVDGDRNSECDEHEADNAVRHANGLRCAPSKRQLPVYPQSEQHLDHRQPERRSRERGLEADRVQAGLPEKTRRVVRRVSPADDIEHDRDDRASEANSR